MKKIIIILLIFTSFTTYSHAQKTIVIEHRTQKGETISDIAKRYGVSTKTITSKNPEILFFNNLLESDISEPLNSGIVFKFPVQENKIVEAQPAKIYEKEIDKKNIINVVMEEKGTINKQRPQKENRSNIIENSEFKYIENPIHKKAISDIYIRNRTPKDNPRKKIVNFFERGKYSKAELLMTKKNHSSNNTSIIIAENYFIKGKKLLSKGDYKNAITFLNKSMDFYYAKYDYVMRPLGFCYLQSYNDSKIISDLENAYHFLDNSNSNDILENNPDVFFEPILNDYIEYNKKSDLFLLYDMCTKNENLEDFYSEVGGFLLSEYNKSIAKTTGYLLPLDRKGNYVSPHKYYIGNFQSLAPGYIYNSGSSYYRKTIETNNGKFIEKEINYIKKIGEYYQYKGKINLLKKAIVLFDKVSDWQIDDSYKQLAFYYIYWENDLDKANIIANKISNEHISTRVYKLVNYHKIYNIYNSIEVTTAKYEDYVTSYYWSTIHRLINHTSKKEKEIFDLEIIELIDNIEEYIRIFNENETADLKKLYDLFDYYTYFCKFIKKEPYQYSYYSHGQGMRVTIWRAKYYGYIINEIEKYTNNKKDHYERLYFGKYDYSQQFVSPDIHIANIDTFIVNHPNLRSKDKKQLQKERRKYSLLVRLNSNVLFYTSPKNKEAEIESQFELISMWFDKMVDFENHPDKETILINKRLLIARKKEILKKEIALVENVLKRNKKVSSKISALNNQFIKNKEYNNLSRLAKDAIEKIANESYSFSDNVNIVTSRTHKSLEKHTRYETHDPIFGKPYVVEYTHFTGGYDYNAITGYNATTTVTNKSDATVTIRIVLSSALQANNAATKALIGIVSMFGVSTSFSKTQEVTIKPWGKKTISLSVESKESYNVNIRYKILSINNIKVN